MNDKKKPTLLARGTSVNGNRQGSVGNVTREEPGVMTFEQVYCADINDVEWLAHPWIAGGRPTLVFGSKDSGKSLVVQDLFLATVYGRYWLGSIPLQRRGRAVLLDYEPKINPAIRLQQLTDFDPMTTVDPINRNDYHIRTWPALKRLDNSAEGWLTEICRDSTLLIVDGLAAATSGKDENSVEAREALDMLTRVSRATGVAVVVTHHEGHVAGRPRGSTALSQASGAEIQVTKRDDQITMKCTSSSLAGVRPDSLTVELTTPDGIDPKTLLAKSIRLRPPKPKPKTCGVVVDLRSRKAVDTTQPAKLTTKADEELVAEAREKFGTSIGTTGVNKLAAALDIGSSRAKRIRALATAGAKP